jgi:hypothetical protein
MNTALEHFGKIFMHEVRDYVYEDMQKILNGKMLGTQAEKVRALVTDINNCHPVLNGIIPYVIDRTLSQLLFTLQEHSDLELRSKNSDGTMVNVVAASDGLSGELHGEGWIRRYSKYPPSLLVS